MRALMGLAVWLAPIATPALAQTPPLTWQRVIEVPGKRGEMTDLLLAPSGAPNGEIVIAGFIQRLADAPAGELDDAGPAPRA